MDKLDEKLLLLIDELSKKRQFKRDNDNKNWVAGLTDKDIYILNSAGLKRHLEKIIGPYEISIGMILHAVSPYEVHSDYTKTEDTVSGTVPNIAVLIPLETKNTHTIVFEQESHDNNLIKLPDVPDYVSNQFWDTHLTHCKPVLQKKLSLHSCIKWERGVPITWHRSQLHCSDNFLNSMENKKALVLFTHASNLP